MTQSATKEEFSVAVLRLAADSSDWSTVVAYIEANYEAVKEQLVLCDAAASEGMKGRAIALRQLLADIRGARQTLERFDASRRTSQGYGTP